jgi:23S rRNA (cytosine1962-C5)-methyltransferase
MKSIRLKAGKERSLQRKHPWIFESAIAKGSADAGETVRVESHEGEFLAWAAFSPTSRIRARVWSFEEAQRIDDAFIQGLIAQAVQARNLFDIQSNGMRLVHGESDGLPGLVVDRYGDTLVAQFTSCGTERFKQVMADALLAATGLSKLYERSDANVRSLEGLPEVTGWLRGEGATALTLQEHRWQLLLDIAEGHKTGFYLDQRDSRFRFFQHTQHRQFKNVLNCFCYTGGFTVAALAGGAGHVTSIDSSGPALEMAKANVLRNGFELSRTTFMDADVNASLRAFIEQGLPGYNVEAWFAVIGPKGLSAANVKRIHDGIVAAFNDPTVKETMAKQGNSINISSPEQAQAAFKSELAKYAALVKNDCNLLLDRSTYPSL